MWSYLLEEFSHVVQLTWRKSILFYIKTITKITLKAKTIIAENKYEIEEIKEMKEMKL